MTGPRRLYRRADDWARGLSRVQYALFTGVVVTASVLGVGVVLDTSTTLQAVTMGVTIAVIYYATDANAGDDRLRRALSGGRFDVPEPVGQILGDGYIGLLDEPREFLALGRLDDDRRNQLDLVLVDQFALLPVGSLRHRVRLDPVVGDAGGRERGAERGELPLAIAAPVAAPHFEHVFVRSERREDRVVERVRVDVGGGREGFECHGAV